MSGPKIEEELSVLSVREIQAAGRSLPDRFRLGLQLGPLAPGSQLHSAGAPAVMVVERLRLLPGRRLVARVDLSGRPGLLKLFMGRSARRYRDREMAGCRMFAAAGVDTPALLAEVTDPRGQGLGILFEYLPNARTLDPEDDMGLASAAAELGRLHGYGAWHGDLHLDNFIYQNPLPGECSEAPQAGAGPAGVCMIDGDGVRRRRSLSGSPAPLGRAASLRNLAVLCAQRPPLLDASLSALLAAYAGARGWPAAGAEFDRLLASLVQATRRQRHRRVARYLRKSQRACTEYFCERSFRSYFVCLRDCLEQDFRAFADDPESFLVGAEILKDGNSATVVRSRIGQRACVIKRYNIKGPMHRLRRALKPRARFRLAWCNGQRLHFLGIPTARPLALVERRFGPLRGVAYLVMEDCGTEDLQHRAAGAGVTPAQIEAVTRVFQGLAAAGLTHGDTKATNFLVAEGDVVLVDLDAMRESRAGQARDIRRFLANWQSHPDLYARFRQRFADAGLPLPE